MSKLRVVHYINNFFAGIGGEEKANIPPQETMGSVGPGRALDQFFGDNAEVVATVICGDSFYGENLDKAEAELIEMIKKHDADIFIAGPAFNAGRYGVACGAISKAVEEKLGIPVVTGMYEENPGVDMYKKDVHIMVTGNSAVGMKDAVSKLGAFALKLANKEEIGAPEVEGYHVRGIRTNYFHEKIGAARAVEMILKKVKGLPYETEYPMPDFGQVEPNPAIKDMTNKKVAIVTSGGVVPIGNPDRIESSSATKYGIYDIRGLERMPADSFTTIHGGYDRTYVLEDINRVVPLDVLRDLENEGVIGELANYFVTTTGTGTAVGNARGFGEEFSQKLLKDGVEAVIVTST